MNILPKKRWHVRTKDNIARVRRDEALAAEEERKKQLRLEKAEREARTEALRKKAREQYGTVLPTKPAAPESSPAIHDSGNHVNLFYELEQNEVVSDRTNEEHEKEKKQEKEEYEKKIGLLTYLGQDTNEITGKVSWYNKPREEILAEREEVSKKQKTFEDPLEDIRKYLHCEGIKKIRESVKTKKTEEALVKSKRDSSESSDRHKKHKKGKKQKKKKKRQRSSTESEEEPEVSVKKAPTVDLERLRAERLRREKEERQRAEEVFARLNGVTVKKEEVVPEVVQKYNSQFNPHLAKQNYSN